MYSSDAMCRRERTLPTWTLKTLLLLGAVLASNAAAQDLNVVLSGPVPNPIHIDGTVPAVVTLDVSNAQAAPFTAAELQITLGPELKLTGGAAFALACTGTVTCTFARISDTVGKVTIGGSFDNGHPPARIQFDVDGVGLAAAADVKVAATSFSPAEANNAVQPNLAATTLTVAAPDLAIALAASTGNPSSVATGQAVTLTATITNLGATNASALKAQINVPGLEVTGFTAGGDAGTPDKGCLFAPAAGANCSFDPTSGILLYSEAAAGSQIATGETIVLTLTALVKEVNYAGSWSARITSVTPQDADASNHLATVGVTINQAPVWQKLSGGPFTGAVPALHVSAAGRVLAGTEGGVYYSKDDAANWCTDIETLSPLPRGFVRGITSVRLTGAVNDERIVVATYDARTVGSAGIFYSDDGGETYAAAGVPPAVGHRKLMSLVGFTTPAQEVLLTGTATGRIYRSAVLVGSLSPGDAWAPATVAPALDANTVVLSLVHYAVGATEVVMAGTDVEGFLLSTDGGATFSRVAGALDDRMVLDLAYNREGIVDAVYAATDAGVYKTVDHGTTWTRVSGFTSPVMRSVTAYTKDGQHVVVAGGDGGTIYFSETAGASWVLSGIGFPSLTLYDLFYNPTTRTVMAGSGNGGFWSSVNNGQSWEQSQIKLPHVQIQTMAFDRSGVTTPGPGPQDGDMLAGTAGLGMYHYDQSCGWEPLGGQPDDMRGFQNSWISALGVTSQNTYLAGTWGNSIYRTVDEGTNWTLMGLPHLNVYDIGISIDDLGDELILAGADVGRIFLSVDGGFTWDQIVAGDASVYAVQGRTGTDHIVVGTFGRGALLSQNRGDTWTQTDLVDAYVFDIAESPHVTHYLYAGTANGLKRSTNGGVNWAALPSPLVDGRELRALAFSGQKLYVSVWGGGLVVYDEATDTWSAAALPPQVQVRAFTTRRVSQLAASGETEHFDELYAITEMGDVYVQRTVAAETGTNVGAEETREAPGAYRLEQNFPNPFNPSTRIAFALPEAGPVRLTVYNALGQQVRVLADGTFAAGVHHVTFEASNLPSGVYFYRMETARRAMTNRMILMK